LSGRGLCDELITRPEESYRLCCVVVCDLETSRMGAPYIYDISHLRVNVLCSENTKCGAKTMYGEDIPRWVYNIVYFPPFYLGYCVPHWP